MTRPGQADLLADLRTDLDRPTALPAAATTGPRRDARTPTVAVHVTPLRWTRPGLGGLPDGVGVVVRAGPVSLVLAVAG